MSNRILFHAFQDGTLWASRRNEILKGTDPGGHFATYAKLPGMPFNLCIPLLNRLTRHAIHHILPLSGRSLMVVTKGRLLFLQNGAVTHTRTITRGSRPLRSGICVLPDNSIICGDYWGNPDREPVRLYISTNQGIDWDILWQSERGQTRHIHLVQPVEGYPDHIYFSTGDRDNEAALYRLHLRDRTAQTIGGGAQSWRMVSLVQHRDTLIWGSDCQYQQNHIYRFNLTTRQLEPVQTIPGPAYYSTRDRRGRLYIATTVEDRRRHQAIILSSTDGRSWDVVRTFQKDIWPPKLFGYGVVEFIEGQEKIEHLLYNLKGLL